MEKHTMDQGKIKKQYRHYHFIGIGGIGMGNLALLMLAQGFVVSGSDLKENDLTLQLKERGACVYIGHDIRNMKGADCVVFSSAVTPTNPEMFHAITQNIPTVHRAELLAHWVNKQVGITVAGAHGKTTTSSMVSMLLVHAGLKPTTAIGGVLQNDPAMSAHLGIGRHMVAEVDESDGSFLHFSPHFSIITNIDVEHLDYYHTFEKVKQAYAMFIEKTMVSGVLIVCGDDPNLKTLVQKTSRRVVFYGFASEQDWVAKNIQCDVSGSSYDAYYRGEKQGHFVLSIPGKHNILNSLAVVALAHELKISQQDTYQALVSFSGVKRRFQKKSDVGGILVFDDYGHHPTEIAATLQTTKTLDPKRTIVVFQPHRYTRTKLLMDDFVTCFNLADYLIVTDIYAASEKPIEGISAQVLVEKIREEKSGNVVYLKKEDIVDFLDQMLQPEDLLITLGAGDITCISDQMTERIERKLQEKYLPNIQIPLKDKIKMFGKIGVLMGGCSSEREVSLRSGVGILEALKKAGCDVVAMDIVSEDSLQVKEWIQSFHIDMAFIALHGRFGEDGRLQAILDDLQIPYNGCGVMASRLSFDKNESQKIFEQNGITTPRTKILWAQEDFDLNGMVTDLGGFPLFVKPASEGSSIGVSQARDPKGLATALKKAFQYSDCVLVQQAIIGRELTVGILGETALPIVEICSEQKFFDYEAKYQKKTTQYRVPAPLDIAITQAIQQEALKVYRVLGCEGFGRVDVLLDSEYRHYILEVNTIPGFTSTSLFPKAAKFSGLNFQQLCLILTDMAYGKKKTNSNTSFI